jgi:type II secretory pathway pseudopilin PulG
MLGPDDALMLPLVFPHGAISTTVYSQSSALTSTLCAPSPSNDVAAILAATRATVAAARQRAQDTTRAIEQEQAVVNAIERQYTETYHCLAGKGVSDGSPRPLVTAPTLSSLRQPQPRPSAPLFTLRRQPSPASRQPSPTFSRWTPLSTLGGTTRSCRPSTATPLPTTSYSRSLHRQRIAS